MSTYSQTAIDIIGGGTSSIYGSVMSCDIPQSLPWTGWSENFPQPGAVTRHHHMLGSWVGRGKKVSVYVQVSMVSREPWWTCHCLSYYSKYALSKHIAKALQKWLIAVCTAVNQYNSMAREPFVHHTPLLSGMMSSNMHFCQTLTSSVIHDKILISSSTGRLHLWAVSHLPVIPITKNLCLQGN